MLGALCHEPIAFALSAPEEGIQQLWTVIEDYGEIVFPLLGLGIIALIWFGFRRGMTSNLVELQKKQEQKDAIVQMMRSRLLVSPEAVAVDLHIDHFTASALLDELVREGKLVQQKMLGGVASYRLKGL